MFRDWFRANGDRIALFAFVVAVAGLIFAAGAIFAEKRIPPYGEIQDMVREARAAVRTLRGVPPAILEPIRHEGEGVTRIDRQRMHPGWTLIQASTAEGTGIDLIDETGTVVHRWRADFFQLWPEPSHIVPESRIPAGPMNLHMHGVALLSNGSVVFNFDYLGSAKLDACSEPLWKIDRMTHHGIRPLPDGTFLIPSVRSIRQVKETLLFPNMSREALEDTNGRFEDVILHVGSDGEILRETSVLQALFDAGLETELYDVARIIPHDPTHLNDIEIVTPALATRIEGASAGDLLLSLRNLHTLAILKRDTGELVWTRRGPWVRQHDPDIYEDGRIDVFDNGWGGLNLHERPGSRILRYDPASDATETLLPKDQEELFFTKELGSHQLMPGGNRLVVESDRKSVV